MPFNNVLDTTSKFIPHTDHELLCRVALEDLRVLLELLRGSLCFLVGLLASCWFLLVWLVVVTHRR